MDKLRILALLVVSLGVATFAIAGTAKWIEVPNSTLRSVAYDWSPDPTPGSFSGIVGAWSGAAFDTRRNRIVVKGGGHGDYGGVEMYAFDLDTLSWSRISEPESYNKLDLGCAYGSQTVGGLPKSMHTYDRLSYISSRDSICDTLGSVGYSYCVAGPKMACYDMTLDKWQILGDAPGGTNSSGAVHPVTGEWWLAASNPFGVLARYLPDRDVWEYGAPDNYMALESPSRVAAIDPKRDLFLVVQGSTLYAVPLNTFTSDVTRVKDYVQNTTGAIEILTATSNLGFEYDPVGDRMVAWVGGSTVYFLDLDSWVWRKEAVGGDMPPVAPQTAGTFGRFAYSPSSDKFVLVNSVDQNVFLLDLNSGSAAQRPSPPPAVRLEQQ